MTAWRRTPKRPCSGIRRRRTWSIPPALCSLGLCYERGEGVPEDKARAVALYTQAAQRGDLAAQCNLGYCYLTGIGTEVDCGRAVEWLDRAARRDSPGTGSAGETAIKTATAWRPMTPRLWSSIAGPQSRTTLPPLPVWACAVSWDRASPEDKPKAAALYRKAAEMGYTYAQCNLGFCYLRGIGVDRDPAQAVIWLQKAAEKGQSRHESAQPVLF